MDAKTPSVKSTSSSRFRVARVEDEVALPQDNPQPPSPTTEKESEDSDDQQNSTSIRIGEDETVNIQQTVNSSNYDSHNVRSLRHYTQEALPRLDHYRNLHSLHAHHPRPTLDELHNGNTAPGDKIKILKKRLSNI